MEPVILHNFTMKNRLHFSLEQFIAMEGHTMIRKDLEKYVAG